MIRFYPISKAVLACYLLGGSLVIAAILAEFYYPGWLTTATYQQLLIAGAVIVTVGSIINGITYIKTQILQQKPSRRRRPLSTDHDNR
ncbi:MAG: hypothetical protein AAGB12_02110 [Pseudomonadota bacterium]